MQLLDSGGANITDSRHVTLEVAVASQSTTTAATEGDNNCRYSGEGQEILSFTKLNEGTAAVGNGVVTKFSVLRTDMRGQLL